MNKFNLDYNCFKWIFGSIAITFATYFTKNPNCLWTFLILAIC